MRTRKPGPRQTRARHRWAYEDYTNPWWSLTQENRRPEWPWPGKRPRKPCVAVPCPAWQEVTLEVL